MHLYATLESIRYEPTMCAPLPNATMREFRSGAAFTHACFLLDYNGSPIAVSQWVSPKRTRSYPYARVYDTMNHSKRVTIIPFVKDEGKDDDRDFLQWDTVSLMSLLGVYVFIAYYSKAVKNQRELQRAKQKITAQEFDYKFLKTKLNELDTFKSDALHWNLLQLETIEQIARKAKQCYAKISRATGVQMHGVEGINKRIEILKREVAVFKNFSRNLAKSAQEREYKTIQPKESVNAAKGKITITNYLGGEYHLTIDELTVEKDAAFIVEKKHSKNSSMPSIEDVKDGFLKMILFTNLTNIQTDGKKLSYKAALGLTSEKYSGYCDNIAHATTDPKAKQIFNEGKRNNFVVFLSNDKYNHSLFQQP